jgi:hypothetical protein
LTRVATSLGTGFITAEGRTGSARCRTDQALTRCAELRRSWAK